MTNSRTQLILQIAQTNKVLRCQQAKVIQHKSYFRPSFKAFAILIPAFIMGWELGRKRRLNTMAKQVVEIGLVAASSQFKRQLINLLN